MGGLGLATVLRYTCIGYSDSLYLCETDYDSKHYLNSKQLEVEVEYLVWQNNADSYGSSNDEQQDEDDTVGSPGHVVHILSPLLLLLLLETSQYSHDEDWQTRDWGGGHWELAEAGWQAIFEKLQKFYQTF